jgi:hypothetical protein
VYAYEVDGLGNSLADFDDPNTPSLLAMPLLGWDGWDPKARASRAADGPAGRLVPGGTRLDGANALSNACIVSSRHAATQGLSAPPPPNTLACCPAPACIPVWPPQVYEVTRARLFSGRNPYFFHGSKLSGLGSPHTPHNYVWPLALAVDALTTADPGRISSALESLLLGAAGNGLVHEGVNVDNEGAFTRPDFGWANAMLVVAVESLLGIDCDAAAEEHRLETIREREGRERGAVPNGGADHAAYYEQLEAAIHHVA